MKQVLRRSFQDKSPAFQDCFLKEPLGIRHNQQSSDRHGPRAFTENGKVARVAAEMCNILFDPGQAADLVLQAQVGWNAFHVEEPKSAHPVFDGHHNYVPCLRQVPTIGAWARPRVDHEAPTVDENHHRASHVICARCVNVQHQAVLRFGQLQGGSIRKTLRGDRSEARGIVSAFPGVNDLWRLEAQPANGWLSIADSQECLVVGFLQSCDWPETGWDCGFHFFLLVRASPNGFYANPIIHARFKSRNCKPVIVHGRKITGKPVKLAQAGL